ncbi:hypothetical protein B6D52_03460, partial [Candidatus Parcubacteria bacterium 4484_255]
LRIIFIILFFLLFACSKEDNKSSTAKTGKYSDDYFIIEYPTNLKKTDILQVITLAKRAVNLSKEALDIIPTHQIKIKIYPSTQDFIQATGTVWWKAAISKEKTIHLQPIKILLAKGILPNTLAHEFAYFAIKEICKTQIPLWLIEGIASYIAKEGNIYFDETIRRNISNKNFIPISDLDACITSGDKQNSQQAYWQSYSFIAYLISKKGKQSIRDMLTLINQTKSTNKAFNQIFGTSINKIEKQWQTAITQN